MFSKVVTALISPLGTALVLGLLGLVLGWSARRSRLRRLGQIMAVAGLGWLWLWSTPVVSEALRGWLEDQAGTRELKALPQAAAMVVLGGGVSGPRSPRRPYPDLGSAGDRLWHAGRLFHAGKAPKLILAGGTVRTGNGSEAEAMQRFLLDMGVPASAMILEEGSGNTASNARMTAEILAAEGIDEVILVTSALHMPRARRLFEGAGLRVIPAPTDYEVIDMPLDLLQVIPDARALEGSARAIKEVVGIWTGR
jgi:uncharacterized SAM-binding protein YcdF (DUF218 family)